MPDIDEVLLSKNVKLESHGSSLGTCNVTLQFDLSRNIDGAVRDVESAINAARTNLPTLHSCDKLTYSTAQTMGHSME